MVLDHFRALRLCGFSPSAGNLHRTNCADCRDRIHPVVDEFHAKRVREARVLRQLTRLVDEGRDYVTVLALERHLEALDVGDNPPFVQFAWRDDLRLQIETQGDHFRDTPYTKIQHRLLRNLGYQPPFELGDDFSNWTTIREAEGCHPASVARFMIETLWLVHGVHFETRATTAYFGVSFWQVVIRATPTKRDIKAEILRRYRA